MYLPGSKEDIEERGLWEVFKDVTGFGEIPHQLVQGMRSIPGAVVSLPEMLIPQEDIKDPSVLPSQKVHDFMGYEGPADTPFGQLAQLLGGSADIAVPGAAITKARNIVKNPVAEEIVDQSRREFLKKSSAVPLAAAVATAPPLVKAIVDAAPVPSPAKAVGVAKTVAPKVVAPKVSGAIKYFSMFPEMLAAYKKGGVKAMDELAEISEDIPYFNLGEEVAEQAVKMDKNTPANFVDDILSNKKELEGREYVIDTTSDLESFTKHLANKESLDPKDPEGMWANISFDIMESPATTKEQIRQAYLNRLTGPHKDEAAKVINDLFDDPKFDDKIIENAINAEGMYNGQIDLDYFGI